MNFVADSNGRPVPPGLNDKQRLVWGALFIHEYQSMPTIMNRLSGIVTESVVRSTIEKLRHDGWVLSEPVLRGEQHFGRGRTYKHKAVTERLIVPKLLPHEIEADKARRGKATTAATAAASRASSPIERAQLAIANLRRASDELDRAMEDLATVRKQMADIDAVFEGVQALRSRHAAVLSDPDA